MIMKKQVDDIPQCVAKAEDSWNWNNRPHIMMNCYDAILFNDAREIYFLDNLMIKQWTDWSCMFP